MFIYHNCIFLELEVFGDVWVIELQSGLKLVQNSALSYDYYYLQAVLQQEDPLHVDLVRIDLLTRALEIAIDSDDASGVFLTILRLV